MRVVDPASFSTESPLSHIVRGLVFLAIVVVLSPVAAQGMRFVDTSWPGHTLEEVEPNKWVEIRPGRPDRQYFLWWQTNFPRIGLRDSSGKIDMFLDVSKAEQTIMVRFNAEGERQETFPARRQDANTANAAQPSVARAPSPSRGGPVTLSPYRVDRSQKVRLRWAGTNGFLQLEPGSNQPAVYEDDPNVAPAADSYWIVTPNEFNTHYIRNDATGRYLSAASNNRTLRMVGDDQLRMSTSMWDFARDSNGRVRLKNRNFGTQIQAMPLGMTGDNADPAAVSWQIDVVGVAQTARGGSQPSGQGSQPGRESLRQQARSNPSLQRFNGGLKLVAGMNEARDVQGSRQIQFAVRPMEYRVGLNFGQELVFRLVPNLATWYENGQTFVWVETSGSKIVVERSSNNQQVQGYLIERISLAQHAAGLDLMSSYPIVGMGSASISRFRSMTVGLNGGLSKFSDGFNASATQGVDFSRQLGEYKMETRGVGPSLQMDWRLCAINVAIDVTRDCPYNDATQLLSNDILIEPPSSTRTFDALTYSFLYSSVGKIQRPIALDLVFTVTLKRVRVTRASQSRDKVLGTLEEIGRGFVQGVTAGQVRLSSAVVDADSRRAVFSVLADPKNLYQ